MFASDSRRRQIPEGLRYGEERSLELPLLLVLVEIVDVIVSKDPM